MLPCGGYFKRFHCPDAKSGECNRPNCHYGGHSTSDPVAAVIEDNSSNQQHSLLNGVSETNGANSSAEEIVPSYTTVPTEHFQGYQGYFANPDSPPPAVPKRPLLPTPSLKSPPPPVRSIRPVQSSKQRIGQHQQHNRHQNSVARKTAPSSTTAASTSQNFHWQPGQGGSNLNTLARDLAAINNEIEQLQKKLAGSNDQTSDGDNETAGKIEDDDTSGYDPEEPAAKRARYRGSQDSASSANSSSDELYRPRSKSISKSNVPAVATITKTPSYEPTPIEKLQKLGQSKNKLLKDDGNMKLIMANKKTIPKEKIATVKPVALLEKKKIETKKSANVSDLFGEDSDSEMDVKGNSIIDRMKRIPKKTASSKSKEDPEDMAAIIEDFIAPTTNAVVSQNQPRFIKDTKKEPSTSAGGDNSLANKKKRIAVEQSNSSIESIKKLRESGGERPKGHLMSARQQLEYRFAQLQKDKDDLKSKQRELNDELRKQQVAETSIIKQHSYASTDGFLKDALLPSKSSVLRLSDEVGTQPKGEKRLARIPKPMSTESIKSEPGMPIQRPTIPIEPGGKVPTKVRQQYLNLMIEECLKYLMEQEAYHKAFEEERAVYLKSTSRNGYLNAMVMAMKRIRDRDGSAALSVINEIHQAKRPAASAISHNAVIGGKQATKHSFTMARSGGGTRNSAGISDRRSSNFSSEEFFEGLLPFVVTMEQQASNGYPRPDSNRPGWAIYQKEEIKKMYVDDEETKRICIRCGKLFQLTPDGQYAGRDECLFHWGRAWKKRIAGQLESRYNCCQGDLNSEGCSVSMFHVSDCMPRRALDGYVYTSDWSNGNEEYDGKAFALDCEMVYTTCGNELARVTVVNDQCQVVYERCVRPDNMILDYNTRFSGLTEELLLKNDEAVTLEEVQNNLSNLFTSKSILIGHSLESDFRALKLIHDKVVDTSIVFPHRLGAPYKRALKTLAIEFLKKFIQDDVDGHDSKEDAITCMDLMKWRVKQDGGRSKMI